MTSSDQTKKPAQLLNGKVCIIQTLLTPVQEHTVYLFLPNWSIFCKAEMWVLGDFGGFFCLSPVQLGWFSQSCSSLARRSMLRIVCFLFWWLKLSIPTADLNLPPLSCLKVFVYSSANVQGDHSNQKQQILPLNSKMHLAEGNFWKHIARARSSQASVWPLRCVPRP